MIYYHFVKSTEAVCHFLL